MKKKEKEQLFILLKENPSWIDFNRKVEPCIGNRKDACKSCFLSKKYPRRAELCGESFRFMFKHMRKTTRLEFLIGAL